MNKHCRGCAMHHNAGRSKPTNDLKKYNDWCCKKGDEARKSIGWCKTHDAKEVKE